MSQLNALQHKITKNLLPKLGLNRTFPRAITYAPAYFGGAGIKDIAVEQSISHITNMLGHFRSQTDLATNYIQLIESYMILSGLPTSPLINTRPIHYVNAPWLEIARTFLRLINGHIDIPQIEHIHPLRQNDIAIMPYALQGSYTLTEFLHINNCRLYLQCMYISEITNDYGTHILPTCISPIIDNIHINPSSTSKLQWPQQDLPPPIAWNTWKKFLSTIVKPHSNFQLKTLFNKLERGNSTIMIIQSFKPIHLLIHSGSFMIKTEVNNLTVNRP